MENKSTIVNTSSKSATRLEILETICAEMKNEMMNLRQMAEFAGISAPTCRKYRRAGLIPFGIYKKSFVFFKSEVIEPLKKIKKHERRNANEA